VAAAWRASSVAYQNMALNETAASAASWHQAWNVKINNERNEKAKRNKSIC